jgi:micrococcal nuclease
MAKIWGLFLVILGMWQTKIGEKRQGVQNPNLYPVVRVVDGDTIAVRVDNKTEVVRMIGVNTPEVVDPRQKVECFGKEASAKTKEWLVGKKVRLEADATQGDRDKYGRELRYVWQEDGVLVNQELIAQGYGFEYTYSLPYRYREDFLKVQKEAQLNKRGLWAEGACHQFESKPLVKPTPDLRQFSCDCQKSCTELSSCEEAYYQLEKCGCKLDGDGDRVPCELICK